MLHFQRSSEYGAEIGSLLRLLPARLRFKTVNPSRPGRPEGTHKVWERAGEAWEWRDGPLIVSVRSDETGGDSLKLHLSVRCLQPLQIELCAVELLARGAQSLQTVDRFLRWKAVRRAETAPELTPLVVRWQLPDGRLAELRSVAGGVPCRRGNPFRGADSPTRVKIRLYLDAAALHPSWRIGPSKRISAAAPVLRPGKAVEVALLLSSPNGELQDAPCIPGRLPAGAEACFTITDHCDFDSTERLRLFLHGDPERRGWLDRGLRLTKSAFALPCKSAPERRAASLCDSEYRGLMETLLLDGSEVAPHGLSLMGTVEPAEFEQALAEFARAWRPGVWIDHGCGLPYCYANGGAYDMRYRLLNRLRQHGFTGLWAYHDAPSDPHRLNLLAPRPATFLGVAGVLARHLQERRAGVALHYVRTAIEQRLDGLLRYPLQELISTVRIAATSAPHSQALRRAIAGLGRILRTTMRDYRLLSEPYRLQELIDLAPIAYPERRVPLNQAREDDLLLFSTAEVSHAADAYTAAAVHLLAEARGIHIGHCYLLNPRSYISGPIERKNGRDRLKASWCAFLDSLSSLVSTGQVWNPTVTQLLAWLRSVQAVECMPEGASSIRLTNTGSREIRDYTVLVPPGNQPENLLWAGAEPKGVRWWWDWVAVWGDLPAHSETVVTWMAGTGARRPLATALG